MVRHFLPFYQSAWPMLLACLALATAGATRLPERRRAWLTLVLLLCVVSTLGYGLPVAHATISRSNYLLRDLAATFLLAFSLPLLIGWLAHWAAAYRIRPAFRLALTLAFALGSIAVSPYLLLAVHCTSGDCL